MSRESRHDATLLRALVVDDEPFIRADLRQMLAAHPDVGVVAEAGTVDESAAAIARERFDVVFLDILLRGGDGFDIVPMIRPDTAIIFMTAFERHAVRAFEVNALDYLVKPVAPERLLVALQRLRDRRSGVVENAQPPDVPWLKDERILIKTDTERRLVSLEGIVAVTSLGGNYSEVHLRDCEVRPVVRQALKDWERQLPGAMFLRVHRNAIVNMEAIVRTGRESTGATRVWVTGAVEGFPVSRRAAAAFNAWMEQRWPQERSSSCPTRP